MALATEVCLATQLLLLRRSVFDLPLELKDKKTTALRITLPPHFPQVQQLQRSMWHSSACCAQTRRRTKGHEQLLCPLHCVCHVNCCVGECSHVLIGLQLTATQLYTVALCCACPLVLLPTGATRAQRADTSGASRSGPHRQSAHQLSQQLGVWLKQAEQRSGRGCGNTHRGRHRQQTIR
jgi:hypothetical protein